MIYGEKNALEGNNDTGRRALFELFNGKLNDFLYFLFHDALHPREIFQPDYLRNNVIEMLIPTECRSLENLLVIRDGPDPAEDGATLELRVRNSGSSWFGGKRVLVFPSLLRGSYRIHEIEINVEITANPSNGRPHRATPHRTSIPVTSLIFT